MNGTSWRFMHLIHAAATGLLQQIPVVGPVLQSVLDEMHQQRVVAELQRLSRLLQGGASLTTAGVTSEQLEHDLSRIVQNEHNPRLVCAILLAGAEAGNHLAGECPPPDAGGGGAGNHIAGEGLPQGRFLYLAADNYASAIRTLEIAAELGFLWRSYHADTPTQAAIPNVLQIHTGDLIALAYRSHGEFRLLLPLLVTASGEHTRPINDAQFAHCHAHAPFVLADAWLTQILQQEGYGADPVFHEHSGLNVKPLLETQVPQQMFQAPLGHMTIWPHNNYANVPQEVTHWIGQL